MSKEKHKKEYVYFWVKYDENNYYCPKCKRVNAHLLKHQDYYRHCPYCGTELNHDKVKSFENKEIHSADISIEMDNELIQDLKDLIITAEKIKTDNMSVGIDKNKIISLITAVLKGLLLTAK